MIFTSSELPWTEVRKSSLKGEKRRKPGHRRLLPAIQIGTAEDVETLVSRQRYGLVFDSQPIDGFHDTVILQTFFARRAGLSPDQHALRHMIDFRAELVLFAEQAFFRDLHA